MCQVQCTATVATRQEVDSKHAAKLQKTLTWQLLSSCSLCPTCLMPLMAMCCSAAMLSASTSAGGIQRTASIVGHVSYRHTTGTHPTRTDERG